jgi:hypothetical protein
MSDETEKTGGRSAILLLVAVLAVAAFSVWYGLQTLAWLNARHWASVDPWLLDVPQPLPSAPAPAKGNQLKAFDYEFIVPWTGDPKKTPSLSNVVFRFDSGQVVVFYDPSVQLDMLRELKDSKPVEYRKFVNVFADHPIDSNYGMYQAVYSASPAQLSPFMNSRDAMRMNVLLIWKLSFGFDLEPQAGPGIYSFDFGKNRGFQFGDPATGRPVAVRVFDDRNHHFRFIFTTTAGSNAKLTQDDINAAIQSLQPVPILDR